MMLVNEVFAELNFSVKDCHFDFVSSLNDYRVILCNLD
jgi:hypothetical protein